MPDKASSAALSSSDDKSLSLGLLTAKLPKSDSHGLDVGSLQPLLKPSTRQVKHPTILTRIGEAGRAEGSGDLDGNRVTQHP